MEVTPTNNVPWIGNQASFGSRNLMHNKVTSCMETQVILPDKPLHKAESPTNTWAAVPGLRLGRQFYFYTDMAQPLLPCPGLCPSNSNRNSIRQPMIFVKNSFLTYIRISYCRTNMSLNFSSTLIFCIFNTKWLLKTEDKSIKTYWGETKHQTIT